MGKKNLSNELALEEAIRGREKAEADAAFWESECEHQAREVARLNRIIDHDLQVGSPFDVDDTFDDDFRH